MQKNSAYLPCMGWIDGKIPSNKSYPAHPSHSPNFVELNMIKDSENQDGANKIDAVGISWYHPDTFDKCLSVFDDASNMHDTYDEWLADAIKTEKMTQKKGLTVFRVYIDPIEFPVWCKKEGYTKIDNIARTYFCSLEAERMATERRRKKW